MDLGAFSINLAVKGLATSRAFCPGCDADAKAVPSFTEVRALQRRLEERGVAIRTGADPATTGPARFVVVSPDPNPIVVGQHV